MSMRGGKSPEISRAEGLRMESPVATEPGAPAFSFTRGRQFFWKTLLLGATTVLFVPVLLYRDVLWAKVSLLALIAVHVAGGVVIAVGNKRHHIAPDRRGLAIRLIGITALALLIWLAAQGLDTSLGPLVFWSALFAIWALHTLGLLMLHVRSRRESAACPFA